MLDKILTFVQGTGFYAMTLPQLLMVTIACALLYLGLFKKYEPLLLVPISFGMLLANLPLGGIMAAQIGRASCRERLYI